MEPQRWEQIQSIFGLVADLPPEQKRDAVHRICGHDPALVDSLLELLDEDARQQSFLDRDVNEIVGHVADAAFHSDHMRSLVQRQIGPYRLIRVLGEGGMGIVYLAERTDIGGLVAIKLLRDAWLSPMRRERFALEQQTLVKLKHPAIARIYDASTMEDGTPWFVMEYADGRPLTEYLHVRGGSVRDDLLLFRRVCEAVQYAHSLAIIHRDLKPSNILVTSEGEVKLLDFGIAKQMDLEAKDKTRTIAGLRLMTPGYAAPEQSAGGNVGVFTDVYSLGVLLYEILTGHLPRTQEARDGKPPEKPSSLARNSGASPSRWQLSKRQWADLEVLCLTALQPEPERRYRSVDAFIRDVTAYLDGRVLEARPNSFGYVVGKFVNRNWLVLASVTVGVLLLAVGTLLFTIRLARARDAALEEAKRTERIQRFMLGMLGDSDAEAGPSNELTVVTLLDRALQQAGALGTDAQTQVQLYQTIGSMYNRLGKYEKSEQILSKAFEAAKHAGEKEKLAAILVQLGIVRGDRGELKQAQQDIQHALALIEADHLPANDTTASQARIAAARIDVLSGDYQKAIDVLTPVAKRESVPGGADVYDIRDSVAALAVALTYSHRYDLAESASRRAIELDKELLGESHPQTGVDLANLAATKASQGDFPEAEQIYRQAIGIMKAWYGPEHPDVVFMSSILGRVLISEKKDAEAEPIFKGLLQIEEKAYGPVHERVAFTLDALGQLALRRGQLREAEADFTRSTAIYHSLFGDNNAQTAAERSNLGEVYLKGSKNALAEATLRQAVEAYETLPPAANYVGLTRARWGRALLALKRYPEAEHQLTTADNLMKGMPHPPAQLKDVRSDLATLYRTTHQPDKARVYQAELDDSLPAPLRR